MLPRTLVGLKWNQSGASIKPGADQVRAKTENEKALRHGAKSAQITTDYLGSLAELTVSNRWNRPVADPYLLAIIVVTAAVASLLLRSAVHEPAIDNADRGEIIYDVVRQVEIHELDVADGVSGEWSVQVIASDVELPVPDTISHRTLNSIRTRLLSRLYWYRWCK